MRDSCNGTNEPPLLQDELTTLCVYKIVLR